MRTTSVADCHGLLGSSLRPYLFRFLRRYSRPDAGDRLRMAALGVILAAGLLAPSGARAAGATSQAGAGSAPVPTTIGSAVDNGGPGAVITVLDGGVPAGTLVTVVAGSEADMSSDIFTGVSDSRGNAYSLAGSGFTGVSGGRTVDVWYSFIGEALHAGDTITVGVSASNASPYGDVVAQQWSNSAGGSFDTSASGTSNGASITTSGSDLVIGATTRYQKAYDYGSPFTGFDGASGDVQRASVSGGYLVQSSAGGVATPDTGSSGASDNSDVIVAFQLPGNPGGMTSPNRACGAPYSSGGPWNSPIGASPVVDPSSGAHVASLSASTSYPKLGSDPTQYTFPVYGASSLSVPVYVEGSWSNVTGPSSLARSYGGQEVQVPVPMGAQGASGSDEQVIVVDPVSGGEWGFWQFVNAKDGVQAAASAGAGTSSSPLNVANAYSDYDSGEQVVVGYGSADVETATIADNGSPGSTQLVFTAPLKNPHPVGDVVWG